VKRIFFLLLVLLAFLVGCSEDHPSYTKHLPQKTTALDDRISMDAVVSAENLSYSRMQLEIPERFAKEPFDTRLFYTENGYFYAPIQYQPERGKTLLQTSILKFDAAGALVDEIPVPGNTYNAAAVRVLSDHRFVLHRDQSEIMRDFQSSVLQIIDADDNILAEVTVPPYSEAVKQYQRNLEYQSLHVTEQEDGSVRILVNALDRLYYYDENLTLLLTVELPAECIGIHMESDGVYILGTEMPHLYRVNLNEGTVTQIEALPVPPKMYYFCKVFWDTEGKMYCVYDNAVYLCTETDGTSAVTKILDWTQGVCTGRGTFWLLNETCMYYLTEMSNTISQKLYCLELGAGRTVEDRQILKLADLSGANEEWLRELIDTFNNENDDYYIELLDFSRVTDGVSSLDQFRNYWMKEGFPDLVQFSSTADAADYRDKGILMDLVPYYEDKLLGCASDPYRNPDGKQYTLPLSMTMRTLAAASSVQSEPLTWDDLYAYEAEFLAASAEEKPALLSTDVTMNLFYSMLMDFYDDAAGTVSFDSGEFERRIQFLERIKSSYIAQGRGSLQLSYGNYTLSGGTQSLQFIQNGMVRLLSVPFQSIDAYVALKFIFGDTPFTLCGYPTKDGTTVGARIYSSNLISISEKTEHLDGCLQFLDFILSDEVQTADTLVSQALPVTQSALQIILYERQYCTVSPSPFNNATLIEPQITTAEAASNLPSDAYAKAVILTDEDCEMLLDFFETCSARTNVDVTILGIIEEELSAYQSGVRTLSDAAKLIQSRVWIYVNE